MSKSQSSQSDILDGSVFESLYYAGANYFKNKDTLENVAETIDKIYESGRQELEKLIKEHSDGLKDRSHVNDLFQNINFNHYGYSSLHERRKECSDAVVDVLKTAEVKETEYEKYKYALGFKSELDTQYKKPCLAVIGQTKAGKSSLLNCLLKEIIAPQRATRLTARVTYITYSDVKFVAHVRDTELVSFQLDSDVKLSDVELTADERRSEDVVDVELRVGRCNKILKNGFDVVDSPGLNENPALNRLCEKTAMSLLPLIVYVLDGRMGLTESDIEDLNEIRKIVPELKIIYFVTKLDRSKLDKLQYKERKEKLGVGDEDIDGESDIQVANRRLGKVFDRLKECGFLSEREDMEKCKEFHGCNLWAVNSIVHKKRTLESDSIDMYFVKRFARFEYDLMVCMKEMLERPHKERINVIQTALESILEKGTMFTSEVAIEKRKKLASLKKFQTAEHILYSREMENTKSDLKENLGSLFGGHSKRLFETERLVSDDGQIPKSSFTDKKENNSVLDEIKQYICQYLRSKELDLRESLWKTVCELKEGDFGYTSFEVMLRNRLFYEYQFLEECSQNSYQSELYRLSSISYKKLGEIFSALSIELQNWRSGKMSTETPQESASLCKEIEGEKNCPALDNNYFLDRACNVVFDEFTQRHKNFVEALNKESNFLNSFLQFGDEERICVKSLVQKLAVQFMRCLDIKTPFHLLYDTKKNRELIGKGGQGKIEKVYLRYENPIVEKLYKRTFSFESTRAYDFAMEIYYSSRLNHPRFLKFRGISIKDTFEGFRLSVLMEYLPLKSVKRYIKNHDVPMNTRIHLALNIAEGIQHLHSLKIIHRDINLKNSLVRENSDGSLQGVVADYGLTKSFGFIEQTERVGTLMYIAPELFNRNQLKKESYSEKVDVFSFGISLWNLISFRRQQFHYHPKFVIDCEFEQESIEKLVMDGCRPERRENIPDELWTVMEECWHKNPDRRPSFDEIVLKLQSLAISE